MTESREQMCRFVETFHREYVEYHNHKETVAYTALALYVAAFGAALVSKEWPPPWGDGWIRLLLSIAALSLAWIFALWFIGWQLTRRRMAAVRVAAAERLLASWASSSPDDKGSALAASTPSAGPAHWWHLFWTPATPEPAGDLRDGHYPAAVINAVHSLRSWPGSEARVHEGVIIAAVHTLWLVAVVKTVVVVCLG